MHSQPGSRGLVVPSMVVQMPDVETVESRPFLRSGHSHGQKLICYYACAKGFKLRTAKTVESTWAKTIADKSQSGKPLNNNI